MTASDALPRSPTVLLLVDYINPLDFPGSDALARRAWKAAQAVAKLKTNLGDKGFATIYANDNYGVWHSEFRELLERCESISGVRGRIAKLLAPDERDITVLKPRHSAFHSTPLDLLLKKMQTRRVVIAGLAADICVHLTAMDAFLHGYEVWVPSDCSAAERADWERQAYVQMERVLKCSTRPSSPVGPRSKNARLSGTSAKSKVRS